MNRGKMLIEARRAILAAHGSMENVARQCHVASLTLVKYGVAQRVARGVCLNVPGQHSWAVVGDCYDPGAPIIDPTLWSYDPGVKGIWVGTMQNMRHTPHGWGVTETFPSKGSGPAIPPPKGLNEEARSFLRKIGPLDVAGWIQLLSHTPVLNWPSREIFKAVARDPRLRALAPMDRIGMLTDENPGGVYLP